MHDRTTRREFLGSAATAAAMLVAPSVRGQTGGSEEQQRIEAAIPARAFATPRKPRKLLIFDFNVNYGGHRSARTANVAFTLMGQRTGAFEAAVSKDPEVFAPASLKQFDAVFLNNNVGNLFEDPVLRQSLVEFVYGGGGLMGVHGTSVAFTKWPGAIEDWPEFGVMLGARGANHRASDEHVFIKLDDPTHPVNQVFAGQGFDYRDEFFRIHEPYSRNRVRVLLSIDTAKTDMNQGPSYGKIERPDNDYALAWVRQYGRGRVFYCCFAHNPYVFWDPKMLQFYLAATQFILGDLPGPTTPSARLTPAIRAQEQLGWRLGCESKDLTLFEAIDKAAGLGLLHIGAWSTQIVSNDIGKPFDGRLSPKEMEQVRLKLDAAGVRLLTYRVDQIPTDEAARRGTFGFVRKMGIEAIIAESPVAMLDTVEKLCDEYDICLAIAGTQEHGAPDEILRSCRDRSRRIGVYGDMPAWIGHGIDPVATARMLADRLTVVQLGGNDDKVGATLQKIRRLGCKPVMFGVEPSGAARMIDLFNPTTVRLAGGGVS
ncbi:MAG: ThuA domain-containing protein [Sedimentisphaerales bacterium]|nr:ThuA domain-containing protein [Sedimentisphaerales bacterium]